MSATSPTVRVELDEATKARRLDDLRLLEVHLRPIANQRPSMGGSPIDRIRLSAAAADARDRISQIEHEIAAISGPKR